MYQVTDEELNSLSRAVLVRYGIDFTNYEPQSFKRRIGKVMFQYKLDSVSALWIKVLKEEGFIYKFIDAITVGLTEMFRNPDLWKRLRDQMIPSFDGKASLNVWHAGCSTGEEVFSLGILLHENKGGPKVNAWATDISRSAIETAKSGVYRVENLDKYKGNYLKYNHRGNFREYFTKGENSTFVMKPKLLSHVDFGLHNLVSDDIPNTFDIIFCRNVLIYFDKKLQQTVLNKFNDHLSPGGYLVIGYYDSDPNAFGPLIEPFDASIKVYRKSI